MDVEMEDSHDDGGVRTNVPTSAEMGYEVAVPSSAELGYEDCAPTIQHRRGSMSVDEERERRASIKAIMADTGLTPVEKRLSIQHLMDGRRNSMGGMSSRRSSLGGASTSSAHSSSRSESVSSSTPVFAPQYAPDEEPMYLDMDMGYGDGEYHVVSSNEGYHNYDQSNSNNSASDGMWAIINEQTKRAEMTRPPCTHYDRRCTIISPCCGMAFGCRICHDDYPNLPPKFNSQQGGGVRRYARSASLPGSFTNVTGGNNNNTDSIPEDNHHNIDRFAIREIICRECYVRQSSKSNNCVNCGIQFGTYHCNICNLWMSAEENPYHCADCGFCRVGGASNFRHCNSCGMCIDQNLFENHNCKAGKYRSNCPVCQEYLFSSRSASHEMPCGHAIHWDCFRQLAAHDSRCPVCKKTAETRDRMMPTWNAMAAGVALQPVPPELARVVDIACNDCEQNAKNRAWHFLGIQCPICQSFNTVVDKIVMVGEAAHEFLEMNRAKQSEGQKRPRRVNRRQSLF